MINSNTVVSYAQFNEDLILRALLYDVEEGFYVDIGANYPTVDSVTKQFYELGWSGINIEPIESLFKQIKKERPRDVNLNCAVGLKKETKTFYVNEEIPGHSTFIKDNEGGGAGQNSGTQVLVERLSDILKKHAPGKVIHFMKIDVEGFEYEVIKGADWKKYRPEVICIESNHEQNDWRPILNDNKYRLFIADGLNEYYLADESWWRTKGYAERAVNISYHSLKQHQYLAWNEDSKLRKLYETQNIKYQELIHKQQKEIDEMAEVTALSLKNVTYLRRIKRSIIGLTTDWLNYKLKR